MRAAFIAAECEPWAKTGGLGDVVDALARALPKTGGAGSQVIDGEARVGRGGTMGRGLSGAARVDHPVDVFLPLYRGLQAPAGASRRPLAVPDPRSTTGRTELALVEFEARGYRVRLVDHPPAFDREAYYGDAAGDYPDNGWRFGLLCRAALEALRQDDRPVDVLHLHDWQAMPAVLYRDVAYADDPVLARVAAIATLHNIAYQGWLPRESLSEFAFPAELAMLLKPGADGLLLLREGVRRAELTNTVSPGYAKEVLGSRSGMGMDPVLRALGDRFGGIINGLDMAVWDPATDGDLPAAYSRVEPDGKATCRRELLVELGFDPDDDSPLLGMIGRLDPQKGFDLLAGATPQLVAEGARVVALGTGARPLIAGLRAVAERHPRAVAVAERFDRALARRIYAGADFFVMPSRFEPCGQGQMIAMRYGTPPIVHRTGGLADTVVDADVEPSAGTGFVFEEPTVEALLGACRRAIEWRRRGGNAWSGLVDRGMAIDWSWEAGPANQYASWYRRAIDLRRQG